MNFRHALLFSLLLLLTGLFIGCGGPMTPEEQANAAGKAMDDGNYDEAYKLYQELLDWKGEGTVPQSIRFKASLESCKCLANLDNFSEAVVLFKGMEQTFAAEMNDDPKAYKHVLTVGGVLNEKMAPVVVIVDFLKYAGDKYPDKKAEFAKLVDQIKAGRDLTDEEKDKFRGLGYL